MMKKKSMDLEPAWVLPNIQLSSDVDWGVAALFRRTSPFWSRCAKDGHTRAWRKLTDRFLSYEKPYDITILAADMSALKERDRPQACRAFRDAMTMVSLLPQYHSLLLQQGGSFHPRHSDAFEVYPVYVNTSGDAVLRTVGQIGGWDISSFCAYPSPTAYIHEVSRVSFLDTALEQTLRAAWRRRYLDKRSGRRNRQLISQLFRSIAVAFDALRIPNIVIDQQFRIGQLVASWVSAFEILVHPGTGEIRHKNVIDFLDGVDLPRPLLRRRSWIIQITKTRKRRVRFATWAYHHAYQARNAFAHGNTVARSDLFLRGGSLLLDVLPLIYRVALYNWSKSNERIFGGHRVVTTDWWPGYFDHYCDALEKIRKQASAKR